jgi:hypothetical protein
MNCIFLFSDSWCIEIVYTLALLIGGECIQVLCIQRKRHFIVPYLGLYVYLQLQVEIVNGMLFSARADKQACKLLETCLGGNATPPNIIPAKQSWRIVCVTQGNTMFAVELPRA